MSHHHTGFIPEDWEKLMGMGYIALITCTALSLAACSPKQPVVGHPPPATTAAADQFITTTTQPANVGDAKIAALHYHDGGEYERDLALVAGQAQDWLQSHADAPKPAIVFDIDETALSNWVIIKRDDFGRPIGGPCNLAIDAPCGWAAWDQLGRDPPIGPTLDLYRAAIAQNVAVFFITGRPENQRRATERNLKAAGYERYDHLYMVPNDAHFASAVDFKAPIRAQLEQAGYTIVVNIGDQPSDLLGGYAQKKYLLPDPFYRVP